MWPHFDLVHFLYASVGHGQIMQYGNLGAKKVVPCLVGVVDLEKKGLVNLNSNNEFKEFLLLGIRPLCKGKLNNVLHIDFIVDV